MNENIPKRRDRRRHWWGTHGAITGKDRTNCQGQEGEQRLYTPTPTRGSGTGRVKWGNHFKTKEEMREHKRLGS